MKRTLAVVILCGALFGRAVGQDEAEGNRFFEEKIRPILSSTCLKCHSVAAGRSAEDCRSTPERAFSKGAITDPPLSLGIPRRAG